MLADGLSLRQIGKKIGMAFSTIHEEIRKNGGKNAYKAESAEKSSEERKAKKIGFRTRTIEKQFYANKDRITSLLLVKKNHYDISQITGVDLYIVKLVASSLGLPSPSAFNLINDLYAKVIKLEELVNKRIKKDDTTN